MNGKPVVSVIIPSYNSAAYLAETINSVLTQKGIHALYELEVLVVDDGSTDITAEVVAEFGDKIQYKRIANSGRPAVPRNIGASLAKGEYLAFLDADDVWLPTKLQTQFKQFMNNPKLALVSSNARRIDEHGKELGGLVVIDKLLPPAVNLVNLIQLNFICTSATMVKTDVFKQLGGFNEALELRAVEDYELWMRIAAVSPIEYLRDALVLYRVHDAATSKHGEKEAWTLMLAVYTSFKNTTGKLLKLPASIALDQQMANAHHDLYKLSGVLGKLQHGLAYLYLRLVLRIKYTKR